MNKFTTFLFLLINYYTSAQYSIVEFALNDTITLTFKKADFLKTTQQIDYFQNIPMAIDGDIIFGTDGELPVSKLIEAKLTVGEQKYNLAVNGMYNPWLGDYLNSDYIKFHIHYGFFRLTAVFADGAGTYCTEWLIFKNAHTRTVLTRDEDIIVKFLEE